ncbi:aspartyl protease [Lutibacter sp. Hel_I_33_5]|uniref:aspartyl protease family protein n=1 Tax=Lutibacter sp. Hel_I_33_5 TaxID=1566289 RepID=UPI0011A74B6B|nr:aspartyl protease family protein [Lutibacter sp. Hel_I_33_5]TVZ55327.1 aspartyl protease [Lutibacter sp. Hel_I_33_5]
MIKKVSTLLFILICFQTFSQSGFQFYGKNSEKESINFKLINNLIVLPLEVNKKELNFILDTGVNKTILFNLSENDSLGLKNVEYIKLQGLGKGDPVEAIISKNNRFQIKNMISYNEDVYFILRDKFDLSSKMGTTIHGIIGYNLLSKVIAKINYKTKKITFYNPSNFKYSKCRKCETFPIEFNRQKPYIDVRAQLDTIGDKVTNVKMLIDSGGSDSLWLFENTKEEIQTPNKYFKDVLGEGLSGTIYGNRSRIPALILGNYKINEPTVSFLDSASTFHARVFRERNGSIGGNTLKRFKIWIDYPNRKITFKKNGSLKGGFNYNMSGLDIIYSGKELVKESGKPTILESFGRKENTSNANQTFSYVLNYVFKFKPSYKVNKVLPDSPADIAGLKKDDFLISINGKKTYDLTLGDIIARFQTKNNKRVRLKIRRKGEVKKFEFRLKKRI